MDKPNRHLNAPRWMARCLMVVVASELALQVLAAGYRWWAFQTRTSRVAQPQFTILCLGDSNTFGMGAVPQRSYPARLEVMLQTRWPQRQIRVINAGVPGFNSSNVLHQLLRSLREARPDVILVWVGVNDWNFFDGADFATLEQLSVPWPMRLLATLDQRLSHLRFYRLAKLLVLHWTPGEGEDVVASGEAPDDKQGQRDQADTLIQQKTVRQESVDPRVFLRQGTLFFEQVDFDRAMTSLRAALAFDPQCTQMAQRECAGAWHQLGIIFQSRGKVDQAQAMYLAAVELDPTQPWYWNRLAEVYRQLGSVESARQAWRAGFRMTHNLDALAGLGRTYADPDLARRAMRTLLREVKDVVHKEPIDWKPYERLVEQDSISNVISRLLEANLQRIIDECHERGIRIGLLAYPQVNTEANPVIHQVAQSRPVALLIDASQALAGSFSDPAQALLSADKFHLNAKGYEVLARYVMETLVTSGSLEFR